MAKIDISKIDGYADMTPEQKIAALEAFETEDPDYSGYVKKDIFDKTASELAAKKKELNEKLTEDEQKKQKEQEEREELQSKYDKLLRESEVSSSRQSCSAWVTRRSWLTLPQKQWLMVIPRRSSPIRRNILRMSRRRFVRKPLKIHRNRPRTEIPRQ